MNDGSFETFFAASAGVAGALVGLPFVAVSVTQERLEREGEGQVHRVRAAASLSAFTNALVISLFALIPGHEVGWTAFVVSIVGLGFVAGSLSSLIRVRSQHARALRDSLFLVGLAVTFVLQLIGGLELVSRPGGVGGLRMIAILVVVCFLIGIARAWELIGGPEIGVRHEIATLLRRRSGGGPQDR
jgi:hypothetical protein